MNTMTFHKTSRWTMRTAWLSGALFAFGLASACGSDPGGPPGGDTDTDGNTPTKPFPEFAEACQNDSDCSEGFCARWSEQSEDRFCTIPCSDNLDCEDAGSTCYPVPDDNNNLIRVCAPQDLCIDPDGDQYGTGPGCLGLDCDQNDPNINPGAPEICDGRDNNCNGLVDDNPVGEGGPCDTSLAGICASGNLQCINSAMICVAQVLPGNRQEICNGADDDCDGLIDEGPAEDENNNFVLGLGASCGQEGDRCYLGHKVCDLVEYQGQTFWSLTCDGENPHEDIPDLCDGIDNNCDGMIDEDYDDPNYRKACFAGTGACRGVGFYDCDPTDPAAPSICNAEERTQNATQEVCDFNDNDCDGVIDNGFVNSDGVYYRTEHCGTCDFNCLTALPDTPENLGIIPKCVVSGLQASCDFDCLPGRENLDGIRENGCEFELDPAAIYVRHASGGGQDTPTCGTHHAPCATIQHGIVRAGESTGKSRVRVSEGAYNGPLTVPNGISVIGGHSPLNWEVNPSRFLTNLAGSTKEGPYHYTLRAENIQAATTISGLVVEGADAEQGEHSTAILVINSNQNLELRDLVLFGGNGGRGQAGSSGGNGRNGVAGGAGQDFEIKSSCSEPSLIGGSAGSFTAVYNGSNVNVSGGKASDTNCPSNGTSTNINNNNNYSANGHGPQTNAAGGLGRSNYYVESNGACTYVSGNISTPENGENGRNGNNASTPGAGASNALGQAQSGTLPLWVGVAGGKGVDGQPGNGGGGGGSHGGRRASSQNWRLGPTGGGGGSGAEGGVGGNGGTAGGAAFNILIIQTQSGVTASNFPVITGIASNRGQGGQGGEGGQGGGGGIGGQGGRGGSPLDAGACHQPGGGGGRGGNGGHGAGGGGGAGGVSFDIAIIARGNNQGSQLATRYQSNDFLDGTSTQTGGNGGSGGASPATAGTSGVRGQSGTIQLWSY